VRIIRNTWIQNAELLIVKADGTYSLPPCLKELTEVSICLTADYKVGTGTLRAAGGCQFQYPKECTWLKISQSSYLQCLVFSPHRFGFWPWQTFLSSLLGVTQFFFLCFGMVAKEDGVSGGKLQGSRKLLASLEKQNLLQGCMFLLFHSTSPNFSISTDMENYLKSRFLRRN
jgi:hypothetical protein